MHADVVIPIYADVALTRACIDSVLAHSSPAMARLILVDDCGPDAAMRPMLRAYRDRDSRVYVLENPRNLGFVGTANRGLSICDGHAVILNSDTRVTPGWLEALLAVLGSSDRIAAVCPLSNHGTLCSVPTFGASVAEEEVDGVPGAMGELPEWTELPTGNGFCMLMRDTARAALGLFDPAYGRGYNEENDWCQRARAQGLIIARANRVMVFHRGEVSFGAARSQLDLINATRLVARYPHYLEENQAFATSPSAHLAAVTARATLGRERWSLHPGLLDQPGMDALLRRLREARGAELNAWDSPAHPSRDDLLLAPLHHQDVNQARAALRGTGRLVTILDSWRPTPMGSSRALRWAQLHASDAVLVPTQRAAAWLAEEGFTANVHVVPWPAAFSGRPPNEEGSGALPLRVVLVAPTATIRGLVEMAVARLAPDYELVVCDGPPDRDTLQAALAHAGALIDFGGTSAALLVTASEMGVPVLTALTGLALDNDPTVRSISPSVEGVVAALRQVRSGALLKGRVPADPMPVWQEILNHVYLRPSAERAESRAAIQGLLEC